MDTSRTNFTGLYLKQIKRDYKTGYTIFKVAVESDVITCRGIIIPPKNQVKVKIQGKKWIETAYGLELDGCTIQEYITDPPSILSYLLSIPGIGNATAENVCKNMGASVLQVASKPNPVEYLSKEAGIPTAKAALIVKYIQRNQLQAELFNLITHCGGDCIAAEKIYKKYEMKSMNAISAKPYDVGLDAGIRFPVCDSIAKTLGISQMAQQRILASVNVVMERDSSAGNTYSFLKDTVKEAKKLLGGSTSDSTISAVIVANAAISGNDTLRVEKDRLYLRYLYWQEKQTAYALKRLIENGVHTDCDPDELCSYAESVCNVKYAKQQREIFKAIAHGGVCVLTGGPGTGKTTVVKGFLTAYEKLFPDKKISLCAPTGRASQRMHEATGRVATTIHRLIEYVPYGDSAISKNETDPIDADCIVVDESSMLSVDVAAMLFSAIRSGTLVLLVGDVDQLPSVGPGNVLSDIINSGVVPVVALTETQRQGADSPIIVNAKRIQDSNPDLIVNEDFKIIYAEDKSIPNIVQEIYTQYHDSNDPFKVQVLCPSRKHPLTGSTEISKILQQTVNRGSHGMNFGFNYFSLNDKVMMTQNNYKVGYFNGDVGIIKQVSEEKGITILLNGSDLLIPRDCLGDMSLAYATTVHKSQGSEYETVIIVLPSEPANMLQRNILYTAITRARKRVYIIAAESTISTAITTETTAKRRTILMNRLMKSLPPYHKEES